MTKKEVDEVIMAANEVVKSIRSIDEIDEMIELFTHRRNKFHYCH